MKKYIAFILVITLCLSLCACGGSNTTEPAENGVKDLVVGTWVREYKYGSKYYVTTIKVHKGGIGSFQTVETDENYEPKETIRFGETVSNNMTWEVKDDILIITIDGGPFPATILGFTYQNDEQEFLQDLDDESRIYIRKAE